MVVKGIVNGGVIAYVEGVRGFIPASKLALNYVEDTNEYLNKPIQVQVFDIDKEKGRLILSAKEILREKAEEERKTKISNVQVGLVTEGVVESLQPYGAFEIWEMVCQVWFIFHRSVRRELRNHQKF